MTGNTENSYMRKEAYEQRVFWQGIPLKYRRRFYNDSLHRLTYAAVSADHSAQHSAAAAEHEYGEKISGYIFYAMVYNQGNHD